MVGTYTYYGASLGPYMTFLRADMHMNYTVTSFHFTAFSFGVILSGATGERWMRMFGKDRTTWIASTGLCAGMTFIMCGNSPTATIFGATLSGLCGSTMTQTLVSILANKFQELRAVAITEANIIASLLCTLAPLAVSAFSKTTLGWRPALCVPIAAFLAYFIFGRQALSSAQEEESKTITPAKGSLPLSYWLCWLLIYFCVASEWSIIYWSADFMEKVANLSKADAAASVSSFLSAMVTGRIIGSRLAREIKPINMLRIASLIAISGFALFWLDKVPLICNIGLFIAGIGISNFYPQTLSLAIGRARGLTNLATARMSMSTGLSTLTAPLLLGMIAERSGIFMACGVVASLLVVCAVMIFLPLWSTPPTVTEPVKSPDAE